MLLFRFLEYCCLWELQHVELSCLDAEWTPCSIHIFLCTSVWNQIWFVVFIALFLLMHYALLLPTSIYFFLVWIMFLMWSVNSIGKTLQTYFNLTFDFPNSGLVVSGDFLTLQVPNTIHKSIHAPESRSTHYVRINHYIWSAVVLDNISLWDPSCGGFTTSVLSGLKDKKKSLLKTDLWEICL